MQTLYDCSSFIIRLALNTQWLLVIEDKTSDSRERRFVVVTIMESRPEAGTFGKLGLQVNETEAACIRNEQEAGVADHGDVWVDYADDDDDDVDHGRDEGNGLFTPSGNDQLSLRVRHLAKLVGKAHDRMRHMGYTVQLVRAYKDLRREHKHAMEEWLERQHRREKNAAEWEESHRNPTTMV